MIKKNEGGQKYGDFLKKKGAAIEEVCWEKLMKESKVFSKRTG